MAKTAVQLEYAVALQSGAVSSRMTLIFFADYTAAFDEVFQRETSTEGTATDVDTGTVG